MTVRDPIFGSGPAGKRAARLKQEYGEKYGFLAATNCITEEEAKGLYLRDNPAAYDAALRKEIAEFNARNNLPPLDEEGMKEAIRTAREMEAPA